MTHRDWFLRGEPSPDRLRVPMATMRHWGICSGGVAIFLRGKDSNGARSDRRSMASERMDTPLMGTPTGAPSVGSTIPTAPPLNARAGSIGSIIEGSSFSGLLTRVEIGHIGIRPKNVPDKVVREIVQEH